MAKLTDPADSLHLDLWMAYPQNLAGVFPVDPIDSLQTLYNTWKTTTSNRDDREHLAATVKVYTDATGKTMFDFSGCKDYLNRHLTIFDMTGRAILQIQVTRRLMLVDLSECNTRQILAYRLTRDDRTIVSAGKFNY